MVTFAIFCIALYAEKPLISHCNLVESVASVVGLRDKVYTWSKIAPFFPEKMVYQVKIEGLGFKLTSLW